MTTVQPFPPNHPSTAATGPLAPPPVAFGGGKDRRNFHPEAEALLRQLQAAGVNREILAEQWGVTLWRIRPKDDYIRIKAEPLPQRDVDRQGLQKYLSQVLGQPVDLEIASLRKSRDSKGCCGSGCKGCISGNREKRREWIG